MPDIIDLPTKDGTRKPYSYLQSFERELIALGTIQADYLYTVGETAVILRLSRRTLERWRRDGRGPKVTRLWDGGRPLYRGKHILEALDAVTSS